MKIFKFLILVIGIWFAFLIASADCGKFRWSIKTLNDKDTFKINFNVKDVTVKDLSKIPNNYGSNIRKEPCRLKEETQAYRIKCKILAYKQEEDKDIHLIICDLNDSTSTMVAEIPNPNECPDIKKSVYAKLFNDARLCFQDLLKNKKILKKFNWNFLNAPTVEIIGISFFDYHSGTQPSGNAKNSMEIHPVLKITKWVEKK